MHHQHDLSVRFTPTSRHVQLHPRKRKFARHKRMSALGQKQTFAGLWPIADSKLFGQSSVPGAKNLLRLIFKRNTALEHATSHSAKVISQPKAIEHHPSGRRF